MARDQHPRRTVATLKGMLFAKGILQRAHLSPLLAEAFNGCDVHAIGLNGKHAATSYGLIIQEHRASTANPVFTPHVGAGEGQVVSEKVHQSGSGFYITFVLHAVDGDGKGQFVVHGCALKEGLFLLLPLSSGMT